MTTTNKVLAGVGIGCLAIILLCVAGVVAGGFWLKGKIDGAVATGQAMKQHEERAKSLDVKFAFTEPKELEPVALTRERVDIYLDVRKQLDAVQAKYDATLKRVTASDEKKKKDVGIGDLVAAGGAMIDMMQEQRVKFLDALEAQKMSPKEFHAITRTIRAARIGLEEMDVNRQRRESLEGLRDNAVEMSTDTTQTKTSREFWAKQAKRYDAELAKLPPPAEASDAAVALNEANQKLIDGYADAIPQTGFGPDVFLPGQTDPAVGAGMHGGELAGGGLEHFDEGLDGEPDDSAATGAGTGQAGRGDAAHAPAP